MKKYIIAVFCVILSFLSIGNVQANDLIFLGDEDASWFSDDDKKKIQNSIHSIQKEHGLNMDIVILGPNDEKGCYRQTSIDMCVKENYFLASDLIVVIKMKSAQSSRGDIRSLIKDDIKTIVSTSDLKYIQDSITSYFKRNDFKGGITTYNNKLSNEITSICKGINRGRDCNIFTLADGYTEFQNTKIIKKYSLIALGIFLLILLYITVRYYYLHEVRKLLEDIHYRESTLDEKKLFPESKKTYKKWYKKVRKRVEKYLADSSKGINKSKAVLEKNQSELQTIDEELLQEQVNYSSQRQIADEIEDLKKINL